MISFFYPGGILLLGAVLLLNTGLIPKIPQTWLWGYALCVWVASLFLGIRFNRSRLFFPSLALILSILALHFFSRGRMFYPSAAKDLFTLLSLLLPLNFFWFLLISERGIFSPRGILRLSLMGVQAAAVFLSLSFSTQNLYLRLELLTLFPKDWLSVLPMPQAVFLCFILLISSAFALFIRSNTVMEKGFFWASLSLFSAFCLKTVNDHCLFYLITSNLILLFSVIENTHRMAFKDELTGVSGRRALNEYLLKLGGRYTIAMADIDHFKKFNDRFGHDTGDEVLKFVASILAGVDGGGRAFRFGGEEFTLVFPGKSVKESLPHLEKLRQKIEAYPFTLRKNGKNKKAKPQKMSVTMSFGAAERNEKRPETADVIKAADKALYKAKKNGRNQVAV